MTPRSFPVILLSTYWAPSLYYCRVLFCHKWKSLHFFLFVELHETHEFMTAYQKAVGAGLWGKTILKPRVTSRWRLHQLTLSHRGWTESTDSVAVNMDYCQLSTRWVVNQVQSPSRWHDQIYDLKQSCSVGLSSIWGTNVRLSDEDRYAYRK